jgi:hypothetical protein
MQTPKMYTLAFAVVLPFLALSSPTSAGSDLKQAILASLESQRVSVNGSVESLNKRTSAHQILAKELGTNMPNDLAQGLLRELNILKLLQGVNKILPDIIDAEQSVAEGKHQPPITNIESMITTIEDAHRQLDTVLVHQREARQAYKRRLAGVIAALIVARPGNAPTYLGIKAALDPDLLDLEFAGVQKSIVAALVIDLNQLR